MPLIEIYRYTGIYTNVCPNTDAHMYITYIHVHIPCTLLFNLNSKAQIN